MKDRLCVLSCRNFHAEVAAAIAAEGWEDAVCVAFPARCGRPPLAWDELRALIPADCGQLLLLGRACLQALGKPPAGFPAIRTLAFGQCFHLVAAAERVDAAIADGAYLLTPSWLADWRGHLAEMGFRVEEAAGFFQDCARELVLLDTGLDPEAATRLEEFRQVAGLPARRLAVGLDHIRSLLARPLLEWRLERERRRHASELADHQAAMDLLSRLAQAADEEAAIAAIEDLFHMLFAPAALHYRRVENGVAMPRAAIPPDLVAAMDQLDADHAWTPDQQGFLLRIRHGEETLGVLAADRLAYPEHRRRYLNLALAVSGVCALAIDNARNRRRLLEAEKMASLGILVAGVAHEVNTPLGVGLAAADSLGGKTRELARRFQARAMTQSDLAAYLDDAGQSCDLLCRNLERIGHLVDAFRQVAVQEAGQAARPFPLRACLEDVIRSLGERLPQARVRVEIDCDPDLQVTGHVADWTGIFLNLLGNSLKHGFRGRAGGSVRIRAAREGERLRVDYRDDGVGMTPEVRARVFDPFFSTDPQRGMGLGMHLVFNLVSHRLGGSIQCESEPGQGARFVIDAPWRQEKETP